jgi:pantothenate synthetase
MYLRRESTPRTSANDALKNGTSLRDIVFKPDNEALMRSALQTMSEVQGMYEVLSE